MMCDPEPSETSDASNTTRIDNCNNNATEANMIPEAEVTVNNTSTTNKGERRRSRPGGRRFSRGRISLTQLSRDALTADCNSSGVQLFKQIPADIPRAQRLSLLTRLALRHTLEILDVEFKDIPGFDNFRAEAIVDVGSTIDQMETDGTFEKATITSLAPNPVNLQMNATMADLKRSINRLQEETTAWEDLVATLQTQEQEAKQQLEQLDKQYEEIPEDVKELSTSFLPHPMDLPPMMTQAVDTVKTISLLMDDYCHSVRLLNCVSQAASRHMDIITSRLDDAKGCRGHDPKENIQKLLSI